VTAEELGDGWKAESLGTPGCLVIQTVNRPLDSVGLKRCEAFRSYVTERETDIVAEEIEDGLLPTPEEARPHHRLDNPPPAR